jgi:uncharacterized membrane protein
VIFRVLFAVLVALYPLIIYFGLKILPASFFGLLLAVLLVFRFGIIRPQERSTALPLIAILLAYAVAAALSGSVTMLLYYPVLVNVILFVVFAGSLRSEEPLLLRVVRARGIPISARGPGYLRHLTAIWTGFFVINGLIAAWTTTASMEVWTIYNGMISYLLIGALILGELAFRRYYKKRHGLSID